MKLTRLAPFAFRVVVGKNGKTAIVYRRKPDANGRDRLQRVVQLSPLAFTAGATLLKDAATKSVIAGRNSTLPKSEQKSGSIQDMLQPGPLYPMDSDWGCRVACYALVTKGLRDAQGMLNAASRFREANGNEAAWWLSLLQNDESNRVVRALRILVEAVK